MFSDPAVNGSSLSLGYGYRGDWSGDLKKRVLLALRASASFLQQHSDLSGKFVHRSRRPSQLALLFASMESTDVLKPTGLDRLSIVTQVTSRHPSYALAQRVQETRRSGRPRSAVAAGRATGGPRGATAQHARFTQLTRCITIRLVSLPVHASQTMQYTGHSLSHHSCDGDMGSIASLFNSHSADRYP